MVAATDDPDDNEIYQVKPTSRGGKTGEPVIIRVATQGTGVFSPWSQNKIFELGYIEQQQAVQAVAKANPDNIQEVAASQLGIINSYYQSGLVQSQQSFRWSLIWGGVGLAFFIAAVSFSLIRQPAQVALISGIGGAIVEVFAGTYLYLYKHASDQLAAFRTSLESTQRLLLANSMCEKLEGEVEQKTRAELINLMVQSATKDK